MLEQEVILAKTRGTGTGASKACRREGLVPAIVYGKGMDSVPIVLGSGEIRKIMGRSLGHIHRIKIEEVGLDDNVMVQAIDRNPVTGDIIHMDLHRISLTEKVKVEIPLVFVGEEELTKQGLILQRQLRDVSIECLPGDIPAEYTVNVANMNHGDTVLAGDLEIGEEIRLITPQEEVVAVIVAPRAATEEEDEEEAEGDQEAADEDKPEL